MVWDLSRGIHILEFGSTATRGIAQSICESEVFQITRPSGQKRCEMDEHNNQPAQHQCSVKPHLSESDQFLYSEDLAPTPPEQRTWTTYNYAALWIGMAHCIPTYMMAAGLLKEGMNWWQALLTILLGNLIVLVPMLANSHGGTQYGLPFPVLCRASFGVRGANFPAILRALVACGWFGIQTWIGGAALDKLLVSSFSSWGTVPSHAMLCFYLFWALNMVIIWKGMDAVRWFEGWAAPAVLVVTVVLMVYMIHRANGLGPILSQPGKFNTTGEFLRVLPIFLTAQIGFWATLSLNMPDFTRFAKDQKAQMWGQAIGLPSTMTFFSGMGVLITSATLAIYNEAIWDPTDLLCKPDFGHPVVVLISLVTIGVATLSVNVAANVVSPAFDFANLWPQKIDFRIGGTITGIIGILIQPWNLMGSSTTYIFTWLVGYSALLGPIAGVMVCDYWLLRKTRLRVVELYRYHGCYAYTKGFNLLAIFSLFVGVIPNIPGFVVEVCHSKMGLTKAAWIAQQPESLQAIYRLSSQFYDFAWMVGFAISCGIYYGLMQAFQSEQIAGEFEESIS
jgi:nucleobase:cation symporter-1, NCS1 family